MSLREVLGLWKVWIFGIVMVGMTVFAFTSPAMGEGYFYEGMFGLAAVVAFGYGIRTIRSEDRYGS